MQANSPFETYFIFDFYGKIEDFDLKLYAREYNKLTECYDVIASIAIN